ncbi:hypothetical protein BC834DRAFT_971826 [Gloeopeniophorella convolvens]|nr:hypothetical protein BC834DRAFT_971826 [Gloeopeniophorella convolvens]
MPLETPLTTAALLLEPESRLTSSSKTLSSKSTASTLAPPPGQLVKRRAVVPSAPKAPQAPALTSDDPAEGYGVDGNEEALASFSDEHNDPTSGKRKRALEALDPGSGSDEDAMPPRLRKAPKRASRLRLVDFDNDTIAVLMVANKIFRCKISSLNAFPEAGEDLAFAKEGWAEACEALQVEPTLLIPQGTKLVMQRSWQLRGELKTKVAAIVSAGYRFSSKETAISKKRNRRRVKKLLHDYGFAYRVLEPVAEEPFGHPVIQRCINAMWFADAKDEGVVYHSYFNPIGMPVLALLCTVIHNCIDGWTTGSYVRKNFAGREYGEVYKGYLKSIADIKQRAVGFDPVGMLGQELHDKARLASGAGSLHDGAPSYSIISDNGLEKMLQAFRQKALNNGHELLAQPTPSNETDSTKDNAEDDVGEDMADEGSGGTEKASSDVEEAGFNSEELEDGAEELGSSAEELDSDAEELDSGAEELDPGDEGANYDFEEVDPSAVASEDAPSEDDQDEE